MRPPSSRRLAAGAASLWGSVRISSRANGSNINTSGQTSKAATLGRALALALACGTSGCAARVDVGKSLGEGPHVRLPYTGVRDSLRRFADYSAVRGDILVPPPASPKRPPDERRRP